MNRAGGAVTAILAAVITLAACGSGGHPAATVTRTVTAVPSSPSPAGATASPSPSPSATARLTRKQAARLYVRIVDPMNRSLDAYQTDGSDNAPWQQFVADVRTFIRNETRAQHQLLAVRWPVRVEPYVRAMVTTDLAAGERCAREMIAAGSYATVTNVTSYNADCTATNNDANATQIRSLLGLPPLQ